LRQGLSLSPWYAILLIKRETAQHLKTMTHTLLLDDCQKFAFQKTGDKVNVCKSIRHARIKHKFDWAGSFIMSVEDARIMWQSLVNGGAVRI